MVALVGSSSGELTALRYLVPRNVSPVTEYRTHTFVDYEIYVICVDLKVDFGTLVHVFVFCQEFLTYAIVKKHQISVAFRNFG